MQPVKEYGVGVGFAIRAIGQHALRSAVTLTGGQSRWLSGQLKLAVVKDFVY